MPGANGSLAQLIAGTGVLLFAKPDWFVVEVSFSLEICPLGTQPVGLVKNALPLGLLLPEVGGVQVPITFKLAHDQPRCELWPVSPGTPQKISVERTSWEPEGTLMVK